MKSFQIDGNRFSTLEEFYKEVTDVLSLPHWWGRNLDALDDVLDDVETSEVGFRLIWQNHELSRQRLGYLETVRQLQLRLERCHPSNRMLVQHQIDEARNFKGPTVFEWLVEIFQSDRGRTRKIELVLA